MSQHAAIATYYRSVEKWNVFIDLEINNFSGSTWLVSIRVSLQSTLLCNMNVTLFGVSANQISVFSITQQSR